MRNKMIGKRFDGGRSPLGGAVRDIGDYPSFAGEASAAAIVEMGAGRVAQPGEWVHPQLGLTTQEIVDDLARLVRGEKLQSEAMLRYFGADASHVHLMSEGKRRKLHNKLVRLLQRKISEREKKFDENDVGTFTAALTTGRDTDPCLIRDRGGKTITTTVGAIRFHMPRSTDQYLAAVTEERLRIMNTTIEGIESEQMHGAAAEVRNRLHLSLRPWSRSGPLELRRPPGSSVHHLVEYDARHTLGKYASVLSRGDMQVVVVENDWGRAAIPAGEWRLPFEFMCWEFRLDDVRVLAFTEAHVVESAYMWLVYGRDDAWVMDDYRYYVRPDGMSAGEPAFPQSSENYEMRRVAQRCYDNIRAACIMLDAQVTRHEVVRAPRKLVERRVSEKRAPPRDYYTVRLLHSEHRAHVARSGGGARAKGHAEDARAPQRGHWRKATWVHFDDQDSGQEQYVNDGGFVVSRTWRRWHFAGDPKNIIHKSYTL